MESTRNPPAPSRLADSLSDIDLELARMASTCRVRLLEPGIVDRVIRGDESVCGSENPLAFDKLRHLLMMHFAVRARAGDSLGQSEAATLESGVIERLRAAFPELAAPWPTVAT